MMKKLLFLALMFFICMGFAADFYLVKNGTPQVTILSPGDQFSKQLEEFNSDLAKTTGTKLQVSKTEKTPQIRFVIKKDNNPRTNDNFTVTFPAKGIMQIECTPFSIQWALNWILEEYAGVHYLFNAICGKGYTPVKNVTIPEKTKSFAPSFPLGREMCLSTAYTRPWFRYKTCINLNHELWKHAFPADKYFANNSYPQAIRPLHNGKRLAKIPSKATHWQPCFSNPETARIAIENILEYLKNKPKETSISLLVNDNGGFCECKECEIANGGKKGINHSEVYYKWVNKVAEGVCKVHPDLIITCGAYTHTMTPPKFKLHKNVCVTLCMDLYAATDPKTMARQKNLIKTWGEQATTLGVWDYCWGYPYLPPRIYFKVHAEMIRYLYKHGCRYYFGENENYDAKEGPKVFSTARLLWDINTDMEKYLDDWYRYAVGAKAAPYLKKYYEFWEKYYAGPATKTLWFASRRATYMSKGDISHSYGLKPGDLAQTRSLMEKVVALAETPGEKERAAHLMRLYEYAESLMKIYGSENIAPDGKIHSPEEAVALLKSIPVNYTYLKKKNKIAAIMQKEPWLARYYNNRYMTGSLKFTEDGSDAMLSQLILTSDYADNPKVKAALAELAKTPGLPDFITDTARVLQDQNGVKNLFTNGSLEQENLKPNFDIYKGHIRKDSGIRSTKYSYDGKYSFMVKPNAYTLVYFREKAEPNTSYLLSMKVFMPTAQAEAYLNYVVYPTINGRTQAYRNLPKIKPAAGAWQTYTVFCRTKKDSNGVSGLVFLRNFERNEEIYIDDVRLMKVGK